jgi:hypothetical protein
VLVVALVLGIPIVVTATAVVVLVAVVQRRRPVKSGVVTVERVVSIRVAVAVEPPMR